MKEMQKAFKKSPKIVRESIDPAIQKAILTIQARSIPLTPTDRGFLRGSNVPIFSSLKGVLRNRAPYAMAVHEGTRPHFPPIEAVQKWADRHGIPAFLVARSISKKGTKGVPFYDRAIKQSPTIIDQIFKSALTRITIKLAKS